MLQKAGLTDIFKVDLATLPTWKQLTRKYRDLQKGPHDCGHGKLRAMPPRTGSQASTLRDSNAGTNVAAYHLEHDL
jgi:hypothetical protein